MKELAASSRRAFLKTMALLTGASFTGWNHVSAAEESDALGALLPRRDLGRTGERVTMLGLGGFHTGDLPAEKAKALIEAAIAGGIRFFDTAASYQSGGSEEIYGKFLTPKYRAHIYLMTKTEARTPEDAAKDLKGSLARLKIDQLDLWQAHAIDSPEDAEKRAKNGVFDFLRQAKAEGKVRHIGFTGHKQPEGHCRALELFPEAETAQTPINAIDPAYRSFIENFLPSAKEKGLGVVAMKTLSDRAFFGWNRGSNKLSGLTPLIPDRISVQEALHFVWSLPVSVLVTGAENIGELEEKVTLARSFRGLSEDDRAAITAKVADLAGKQVEFYKA